MKRGALFLALSCLLLTTVSSPAQESVSGMPTSGGYKPPALSLESLIAEGTPLANVLMTAAASGDMSSFSKLVQTEAASGDIGAELLLGEQYIPEQCAHELNRDVPYCGPDGNEAPNVVFRKNALNIPASYEEAARWLEHASAQGSGEASEVLAQLITRMLTNGHTTNYTAADSTRLHALARSQGFEVEPISVTCFQLYPSSNPLTLGKKPEGLVVGKLPESPFSEAQLAAIRELHPTGTLRYQGGSAPGDSVLLMRPEGPPAHVSVVLDHDPGREVHLPIPAHQDRIYVQTGDNFIAIPSDGPILPRFISIMPQSADLRQVLIYTQLMSGAFSGGSCGRF